MDRNGRAIPTRDHCRCSIIVTQKEKLDLHIGSIKINLLNKRG